MSDYKSTMKQKKKKGNKGTHKDGFRTFLLLLPYGMLFLVFIAIPVAMAIGLSFTYFDVINAPKLVWLNNYISLITQDEFF